MSYKNVLKGLLWTVGGIAGSVLALYLVLFVWSVIVWGMVGPDSP
ncbi:hypothetical protein [Kitasatospora aureofaciens]|nr:hypothetical protein [Kitasatospora aureofaciens]